MKGFRAKQMQLLFLQLSQNTNKKEFFKDFVKGVIFIITYELHN